MRGLVIMRNLGWPVIFDATHSVQLPGAAGAASGGQPEFIEPLASAAVATGAVDGLFLEVHDRPEQALSDGANSLPLSRLADLLQRLRRIRAAAG
jgi:2-dehydro-3-deoxyphosphooctonate aldolase (KDO 8-P synthase)